MKILVCGSRTFNNYGLLEEILDDYIENEYYGDMDKNIIISGGANGADKLAEEYADYNEITKIIHLAEWDKYGKKAGHLRNQKMIDEKPDLVIAFWDGQSKGTADTIQKAKQNKINTFIVYDN